MAITITVQNNKAMQCYGKLKKQIQQDNIVRTYRAKRYFMTSQQKKQAKVSMRVMRAMSMKLAQRKNVSSAS
jgi:ribosomal protein S21